MKREKRPPPKRAETSLLSYKEFYVLAAVKAAADSRGAFTPANVHRTFSVRLNRFTGTKQAVHIGSLRYSVSSVERGTKPLHTKNPSRLLLKGSESGGYLLSPDAFPQSHRRCCVWALLPSPRGSAAPLCARLRLYPAPLMHREDNGAAHSWDITKKGSLKKKLGLSLFSSGATKINSSTLGVRGLASFLSHSEERCEAS